MQILVITYLDSKNLFFRGFLSRNNLYNKSSEIDWEGENPGKLKDEDEGVGLIKVYHKEIAPSIQPISVEEEFNLGFENVAYTLKGYLDPALSYPRISLRSRKGGVDLVDQNKTIRDTKTAKRSYPQDAAKTDIQLTAYNLAPLEILLFSLWVGDISNGACENQQVCSWCGYREVCKKW